MHWYVYKHVNCLDWCVIVLHPARNKIHSYGDGNIAVKGLQNLLCAMVFCREGSLLLIDSLDSVLRRIGNISANKWW